MERATSPRFSAISQSLHWLTAILVLLAFIYGMGGPEERIYSEARSFDLQLHETLGISVFMLALLRVIWLAIGTRPAPVAMAAWMHTLSKVIQGLLYLLLFAVPLTAIAGAWLEGHALTFLGGLQLAPWVTESHALGKTVSEIHTWLGDAILWLAGLHAVAALYHHYFVKDNVLRSMLPGWLLK